MANSAISIGVTTGASQSDQETGTSTTTVVTPGRQQYHPSAAKAWVNFNGTGTVATRRTYNVDSITDHGTGDYTVNFTTAMSDENYVYTMYARPGASGNNLTMSRLRPADVANTGFRFAIHNTSSTATDCEDICLTFFGDQ